MTAKISFQDMILRLQQYWAAQGCVILQPFNMGVGRRHHSSRHLFTRHWPRTVASHVCPALKTARQRALRRQSQPRTTLLSIAGDAEAFPDNIQELYLQSLQHLGVDPLEHDIRFVEDNWESPTLGAWGRLGSLAGRLEISQFTYFLNKSVGLDCRPVGGEITYGLERLAMYLQDVDNLFDLIWTDNAFGVVTYGDVFHQNEVEMSAYNFKLANVEVLFRQFDIYEQEAARLITEQIPLAAYEMVLKASHF